MTDTDQFAVSLRDVADRLMPGTTVPPRPGEDVYRSGRARYARRRTAAAGGVLAIAGVVCVLAFGAVRQSRESVSLVPAAGPELGRHVALGEGDAEAATRFASSQGGDPVRVDPATAVPVLAVADGPPGEVVVIGLRLPGQRQCFFAGPPHDPQVGSEVALCGTARELTGGRALGLGQTAPTSGPHLLYGIAPAGTVTLHVRSDSGATIQLRAYQGGDDWEDRAFFVGRLPAGWQAHSLTVQAVDEGDRELASAVWRQ